MPAKKHTSFAIKTDALTKTFGTATAVDAVTLAIPHTEIYALVGPNGSGKTTLMKLLVGLLHASSGRGWLDERDITDDPQEVHSLFGYVSDDPRSYEYLTGYEFLVFTGRLHGLTHDEIEHRISTIESVFPIHGLLPQQMTSYSRGTMQKVAILAAILSKPKILFIDEPIVGLDPASIEVLGKLMQEYAKEGGTVFFSTHILQFAQKYATKVGILHKGKLIRELGRKQARSLVRHFLEGTTFT